MGPLALLATLNTTLLVVLSSYVSDPIAMKLLQQSAGPGFASLVATVAPALCVYASLYVLGPAFRYLQNQMRNSRIQEGNSRRRRFAQVRFSYIRTGNLHVLTEYSPSALINAAVEAVPGHANWSFCQHC